MSRIIDLSGKTFGRLTVIGKIGLNNHREVVWKCVCTCGQITEVPGYQLRSGTTKSCGCYKTDWSIDKFTTHGLCRHPLYAIWSGMKTRCYNDCRPQFKRYGGRGIRVCDEWLSDFESFYKWSIQNGWEPGLSIDRIDNDGNYCPENCRWADGFTQANNSSHNHVIEYCGEKMTCTQWAHRIGIKPSTLNARLRSGWSVEKALTTPLMKNQYKVRE